MNKNLEILSKLNLIEKIRLISGKTFFKTKRVNAEIGRIRISNGTFGVIKESVRDNILEGEILTSTCFPSPSMLACSFDRDLVKMFAKAISVQARNYNVDILLAPAVNIKRNLLGGKNHEYFSEDPYLSAELGISMIKSIQNMGVGACLKYFAVSNQEEKKMQLNAIVDERTLKEIYLYAFDRIIKKAKPYAVMIAENKLNGVHLTENRRLLIDILREQMGYDGILISNFSGISNRIESIKCGLDLKFPSDFKWEENEILKAVKDRKLNESDIDKCCLKIIKTVRKCKQNKSIKLEDFSFENSHQIARELASQSMVLLKNEDNILPLDRGVKLGVIGGFAKKPIFQKNERFSVNAFQVDSFLDELENEGVDYKYAKGYSFKSDEEFEEKLLNEAKTMAKMQEGIVIFCGSKKVREGEDRENFELPKNQQYLINEILKINKNVVLVLLNNGSVDLSFCDGVKGVLYAGLSGESTMGAVSDILFGDVNPSGKLSETFIKNLSTMPFSLHNNLGKEQEYREGVFVGYRYYNSVDADILYPFGYGLSYTQFEYSNLIISSNKFTKGGIIDVSFDIENVGDFDGAEIGQLYVRRKGESPIPLPNVILKGFEKEFLGVGEKRTVYFELTDDTFSFYNTLTNRFEVICGEYEILIGENSKSFKLVGEVEVTGNDIEWQSVSEEYFNLTYPLQISENAFYNQKMLNQVSKDKMLKFDLDSTLEEMWETKSGKLIYKRFIKKLSESEKEKYEKIIKKVPLRAICTLSGGKVNIKRLESYLDFANGKKMKGFLKFLSSALKTKVF